MTVKELIEKLDLSALSLADETREVSCGYAGDLLSWVMGRAPSDAAWFTIMSNVNIVAVAMLRDVATIVVCEAAEIGEDVIERAAEQDVNLLLGKKGIYEYCTELAKFI